MAVAGCRGSPSRQPLVPHLVPFSGQQGHGKGEHEFRKVIMITNMLTGCYFGQREYLGIFCGHIATHCWGDYGATPWFFYRTLWWFLAHGTLCRVVISDAMKKNQKCGKSLPMEHLKSGASGVRQTNLPSWSVIWCLNLNCNDFGNLFFCKTQHVLHLRLNDTIIFDATTSERHFPGKRSGWSWWGR